MSGLILSIEQVQEENKYEEVETWSVFVEVNFSLVHTSFTTILESVTTLSKVLKTPRPTCHK